MDFLAQLREAYPRIVDLGAEAVSIASKPASMAQSVMDSGWPFQLWMDPTHTVRAQAGIDRMGYQNLLKPSGGAAYAKSLGSWKMFRLELSEANQRPALLLLDADQHIVFEHVGNALGDYPTVDMVLDELVKLQTGHHG